MTRMIDIYSILPVMIVAGWALLLLVVDLWIPRHRKGITALLAAVGLAIALGFVLASSGSTILGFNQMVVLDGFASFMQVLFLVSGMAAVALAYDYIQRMNINHGEFYVLMMFSIAGMMLMSQAYNLLMVFLALELLSIPLYVLAGFARTRLESEEASLKYFLLGAFASGFVLYGTALVFSATGQLDFVGIAAVVSAGSANSVL
ncbi:MAG: NADH-quinone oxidoreductase subunit N, partial [Anaerolineaceae bacterium]|nr:NADH-quinone oxidoreductase subunit N [Anaerolineaceae bacterium]